MPDEIPAKLRLKTLAPGPGPEREPSAAHDVRSILQANLESEKGLRVNQTIVAPRKKSKRLRDYLICIILGNLLIVFLVWIGGLNIIGMVYGLAGIVMLTCGLTWVMFQIMDDY